MIYTFFSFVAVSIILLLILSLVNEKAIRIMQMFNKTHTDLIKGIATILIVISHIANIQGFNILIPLGGIGVTLFLISSGYGLNESFKKKGLDNFFLNRLLKITIPYWIMVIIYWLIHYDVFATSSFLKSIILVNRLPYMWFIQYIFLWYLSFYISKKFFSESKSIIFLSILSVFLIFIFHDNTWGEQSFSFTLGVLYSQYKNISTYISFKKMRMLIFLFIGMTFSTLFLYMKIAGMDTVNNYWLMNLVQMLMKLSISIFIIQITYFFKIFIYPSIIYIGLYSYEIYLSHTLLLDLIEIDVNYSLMVVFFLLVGGLSVVINKLSNNFYQNIISFSNEN